MSEEFSSSIPSLSQPKGLALVPSQMRISKVLFSVMSTKINIRPSKERLFCTAGTYMKHDLFDI